MGNIENPLTTGMLQVTPNDNVDINQAYKGIWVESGGDLAVMFKDSTTHTFAGLTKHQELWGDFKRVLTTGTTITSTNIYLMRADVKGVGKVSSGLGYSKINGIDYDSNNSGVDAATEVLNGIDYAHHEIHSGSHYYAYKEATLASTEKLTISVQTPNTTKWGHLLWKLSTSDTAVFDVLEAVTSISGGTAFTVLNNDRNSSNTSGMTVKTASDEGADTAIAPTGGTEIYAEGLKGGNKVGAASRGDSEIILKQNSLYLFRITSAANSNVCSAVLEWYEHTNKN